jgi:hypothetical protein
MTMGNGREGKEVAETGNLRAFACNLQVWFQVDLAC